MNYNELTQNIKNSIEGDLVLTPMGDLLFLSANKCDMERSLQFRLFQRNTKIQNFLFYDLPLGPPLEKLEESIMWAKAALARKE